MNSKKGYGTWILIIALATASVFVYSFNATLAAPIRPPHPGHPPGPPPGHPPGPHPGPHPLGPPLAAVIGPPAPWKAMGPPPAGKVWFHFSGAWVAVPPPPGEGPYLWNGTVWVIDPTPPPEGAKWVAGHWTPNGWIAGHWAAHPAPSGQLALGFGTLGPKGSLDTRPLEISEA